MSTWHLFAVERLGPPQPSWPSIYGPISGPDPIVANGLRTVDLTPFLRPLDALEQELERDLMKATMGQLNVNFMDAAGTVAALLGPKSTTLATLTRYYGPWIRIEEHWTSSDMAFNVTRFTGYLDELSLEWDEAEQVTKASVIHTSNLLKERILSDWESLKRPWPKYPAPGQDFHAVLGEDILEAAAYGYHSGLTHAQKLAKEQALWAAGRFSWTAGMTASRNPDPVEGGTGPNWTYDPPDLPSPMVTIHGQPYAIESYAWDSYPGSLYWSSGNDDYAVCIITLSGAPDLSSVLHEGDAISWPLTEGALSYYQLAEGIPEPPSGQDGPSYVHLTSVEHLVAGDKLTITYKKDGKRQSKDIVAVDIEGTTNRVYVTEPINEAIPGAGGEVLRIRRDNRDPVLIDGVAYAQRAIAPWALDVSQLNPAMTSWPVLSWMPLDTAIPAFYGVTDLQGYAGQVQISRRGADGEASAMGIWRGPASGPWVFTLASSGTEILQQYGNDFQFPGASAHASPMALYVEGDLISSVGVPVNGWRRTSRSMSASQQGGETTTWAMVAGVPAITWAATPTTVVTPGKLIAYSSSTAAGQGFWARTSGGAWSWTAFGASAVTLTPSGTLPTGNWLALGMGVQEDPGTQDHIEAVLGLVVTGDHPTYTSAKACLMEAGPGGSLAVVTTATLNVTLPCVWAIGGGLVMAVFSELLGGHSYQHTRLWHVNGHDIVVNDLPTLEVIPGTIQPLGLDEHGKVSGWMMLALESYATDADGTMARRARLVKVGQDLRILNGDPEANPSAPTNDAVRFRRGIMVQDPMPAGVIGARMIRTGDGDRMLGFLGGRMFSVDTQINRTLERVKIDGLSALDLVELLGQSLLATAVPKPDGSLALVSRNAGALRGDIVTSAGAYTSAPCGIWFGTVRVDYEDPFQGTKTTEVRAVRQGGKILDIDLGKVISGASQAYAIGSATCSFWGVPPEARALTLSDITQGLSSALPPPFWAAWNVGDRLSMGGRDWKLTKLAHSLETREASVELLEVVTP